MLCLFHFTNNITLRENEHPKFMVRSVRSNVTEFLFLGFSDFAFSYQVSFLSFFVCSFILSLIGNGLIIVTVTLDPVLHTPMYFFLRNLSLVELCSISVVVPKALENFMSEKRSITRVGCIIQMYIYFTFGVSECVFLGVMAFDRYMAICHPLQYMSVMSPKLCYRMTIGSWVVGSFVSLGQTSFIFSLPFCGSNLIAHFFCDIPPLLTLACANTFMNKVSVFMACLCGATLPLLLILCSYINILSSVLLIRSAEGRHKALSTCSSHLASVLLFYGTAMFMYLRLDSDASSKSGRMIALFYCVIIPTINPLIYSLRNKEMKKAIWTLLWKTSRYF
ncbi:olfactory receptor 10AG1-like [Dendrobates tinctorius]|uniref:olfactory receptor 10AG1-like n=1 Tax=Dendrobates tinctorius TaxID=92724 RepID=UPI003CCA11CE